MRIMTSKSCKRERANSTTSTDPSTAEYDDWARKFVNRPIPQIGIPVVQTIGAQLLADGVPANEGFDLDSAIGRFAWETIGIGKDVPSIFRNGEKYCSVRMLETSVLAELLQVTPQEIYDSAKVQSFFATNAEAKLLTYINSWHCDSRFGPRNFSGQDLLVTLEESIKLYQYILFAYEVLSSGGKNKNDDYSKCGFVRVNNDSLIPYTILKDGQKSVPLFYFEGQTDILKEKAEPLSGWELSYLKICCKVQGVRKDLIAGDILLIVKLADLKSYFPKKTTFVENLWPPPKAKSLLPKQNSISSMASIITNTSIGGFYNNSLSITSQTNGLNKIPNRVSTNENFQNHINSGRPIVGSAVNNSVNRVIPSNNSGVTPQGVSILTTSNGLLRTNNSGSNTTASNSGRPTNLSNISSTNSIVTSNGITIQLAKNNPAARKGGSDLTKLRLASPPADFSRLTTVPEIGEGNRDGAYTVRMIIIEDDVTLHCVNSKPFKPEAYLIVLQELMNKYFPNVSIYPTAVSVLKSIGITTFLPNSSQISTLNQYGFTINRPWEVPLVNATDAVSMLPRIKLLLTPKPTPTRVNNNSIVGGLAVGNNSSRNASNNVYNSSNSNNSTSNSLFYSNSTLGHAR